MFGLHQYLSFVWSDIVHLIDQYSVEDDADVPPNDKVLHAIPLANRILDIVFSTKAFHVFPWIRLAEPIAASEALHLLAIHVKIELVLPLFMGPAQASDAESITQATGNDQYVPGAPFDDVA